MRPSCETPVWSTNFHFTSSSGLGAWHSLEILFILLGIRIEKLHSFEQFNLSFPVSADGKPPRFVWHWKSQRRLSMPTHCSEITPQRNSKQWKFFNIIPVLTLSITVRSNTCAAIHLMFGKVDRPFSSSKTHEQSVRLNPSIMKQKWRIKLHFRP